MEDHCLIDLTWTLQALDKCHLLESSTDDFPQPQPPMRSLLLGHLDLADECRKLFPKDIHSQVWPDYIREKYKLPETFYVDW